MTLQGEALRLRSGQVSTSIRSTSHHLYSHQTQDLVVMSLRPQEDPYSWPAHLMVRPEVGSVFKTLRHGGGSSAFNTVPQGIAVKLCNREAAAFGEFVYPQAGWDLSLEGGFLSCLLAGRRPLAEQIGECKPGLLLGGREKE